MSIVIKNVVPVTNSNKIVVLHHNERECSENYVVAYVEVEEIDQHTTLDIGQPSCLDTMYIAAIDIEGVLIPLCCLDVPYSFIET